MVRTSLRSALSLLLSFPLFSSAAPTCTDLTLTVKATAEVREITLPPDVLGNANAINDLLNSLLGVVSSLYPLVPVSGTYDISAKYCEPENQDPSRSKTIQLLVHGATYTKTYWSGLGLPQDEAEPYSWIDYASKEGYPTLSIDRLGAGDSSHPDPTFEVQSNMHAEIVHEIITMLRNGEIGDKVFDQVIYVGHSLGSVVGSLASKNYHADIDALILTGFSTTFIQNLPTILGHLLPLPAAVVDSERFGDLPLTYLTRSSRSGNRKIFYDPENNYDPEVADHDFDTASTLTAAEILAAFGSFQPSNGYQGVVQVVTGERDICFCTLGKCSDGPGSECDKTSSIFPDAANYSYSVIPNAGHCLNLLNNAELTFEAVHNFLDENGF